MLIATLFIMTKIWKQPKCPPMGEWIRKIWYMSAHTHTMEYYTMEHYSAIRKENLAICENTDGLWGHYTKWGQSDKDKYMWNLKKKTNKLQFLGDGVGPLREEWIKFEKAMRAPLLVRVVGRKEVMNSRYEPLHGVTRGLGLWLSVPITDAVGGWS